MAERPWAVSAGDVEMALVTDVDEPGAPHCGQSQPAA